MQALLKTRLKESRYEHSVRAAKVALELAEHFSAETEKAHIAGLLHDCAREVSTDELLAVAKSYSLPIESIDKRQPILLHADLGAIFAREKYHVYDDEICRAIKYHTVAHEQMTTLEKITYLADLIEPGRCFDGVEKLRELAKGPSLDALFLTALDQSIIFIISKGQMIHPQTILARNHLLLTDIHG